MIVCNYSTSKNIELQLRDVLNKQREIQLSIDAAHSKSHLLDFLMEQLSMSIEAPVLAVHLRLS